MLNQYTLNNVKIACNHFNIRKGAMPDEYLISDQMNVCISDQNTPLSV